MGLLIKESKNKEGNVTSFAGLELDTQAIVIRLPEKKLLKAREIIGMTSKRESLRLLEIQKNTGNLNFASAVVPLG